MYRFDWLERNGFRYYIDGERVAEFYPPVGGFYEFGRFGGNNIWVNGSFMAPFDKQVLQKDTSFRLYKFGYNDLLLCSFLSL